MMAIGWLLMHGYIVLAVIAFIILGIYLSNGKENRNQRSDDNSNPLATIAYLGGGGWAAYLSWGVNDSIFWAMLHGFLSYFYLIYYYFFR